MHAQFSALMSDANRQVQIADHLLTVTYPMVKDPKLLMSVIEHCRRAIEDAMQVVVETHVHNGKYEKPKHVTDTISGFTDLVKVRHPGIAAEQDAIKLYHDFKQTLQQHKESHTTFKRDETLVIAGEGFEYLKEVTPSELKRSLQTIKQFVHGVNLHIIAMEG